MAGVEQGYRPQYVSKIRTLGDLHTECGFTVYVHDLLRRAEELFNGLGVSTDRRVYLGPKMKEAFIREKPSYPRDEEPEPDSTSIGRCFGFTVYGDDEEGINFLFD